MAANILVNQGYRRLCDHEFTKTPAVGFVLQLLHRSFEHTDAAIVAFTTGSPGSSEGLSRMAFESSISIRYILADQPESRLLAYFQRYKNEEEGRLKKWREATQKLSEPAKREQAEAIALRTRGVEALSHIIDRLENEFRRAGITLVSESWPNLFERFKKLEAAITHRTVYARMSGQVHSDAEETIRYIIGVVSNDADFMERMAAETVWFSRLMLYLAVSGFVHASLAYCHIYRMDEELAVLKRGQLLICEELDALARNAPDNT